MSRLYIRIQSDDAVRVQGLIAQEIKDDLLNSPTSEWVYIPQSHIGPESWVWNKRGGREAALQFLYKAQGRGLVKGLHFQDDEFFIGVAGSNDVSQNTER